MKSRQLKKVEQLQPRLLEMNNELIEENDSIEEAFYEASCRKIQKVIKGKLLKPTVRPPLCLEQEDEEDWDTYIDPKKDREYITVEATFT